MASLCKLVIDRLQSVYCPRVRNPFFFFVFFFGAPAMSSPLFVDPKVCLSQLQRQLSPLRAPPMEGEAYEKEFEFLIEENYLAPSSFKFYHVRSGRPDEWLWLIPHSCSPEAEDDADGGIIAFLRRSKGGTLCFGSCGEYHWASPVGPIHFTNFACEMSPKVPTHDFTWYPVRGENLAVWQSEEIVGTKTVTRFIRSIDMGYVKGWTNLVALRRPILSLTDASQCQKDDVEDELDSHGWLIVSRNSMS